MTGPRRTYLFGNGLSLAFNAEHYRRRGLLAGARIREDMSQLYREEKRAAELRPARVPPVTQGIL